MKMISIPPSPGAESAASRRYLQPSISGLELDPLYSGPELDRIVCSLEPVLVEYGLESIPAKFHGQNALQVLLGTEEKEAVIGESPAGLIFHEPNEYLPRKRSWYRLVITLVLFVILI